MAYFYFKLRRVHTRKRNWNEFQLTFYFILFWINLLIESYSSSVEDIFKLYDKITVTRTIITSIFRLKFFQIVKHIFRRDEYNTHKCENNILKNIKVHKSLLLIYRF